jgi:hypothetical protein
MSLVMMLLMISSIACFLVFRIMQRKSKSELHRQAYESWKDVVKRAIETAATKDARFIEILALLCTQLVTTKVQLITAYVPSRLGRRPIPRPDALFAAGALNVALDS